MKLILLIALIVATLAGCATEPAGDQGCVARGIGVHEISPGNIILTQHCVEWVFK